MTPLQAQIILDTFTELREYAALGERQMQLQADARRVLGIPTREPGTAYGGPRTVKEQDALTFGRWA